MPRDIGFLYKAKVIKREMAQFAVTIIEFVSFIVDYVNETKFFLPLEDVMSEYTSNYID